MHGETVKFEKCSIAFIFYSKKNCPCRKRWIWLCNRP